MQHKDHAGPAIPAAAVAGNGLSASAAHYMLYRYRLESRLEGGMQGMRVLGL